MFPTFYSSNILLYEHSTFLVSDDECFRCSFILAVVKSDSVAMNKISVELFGLMPVTGIAEAPDTFIPIEEFHAYYGGLLCYLPTSIARGL